MFDVFIVVLIQIVVFWVMRSCSLLGGYLPPYSRSHIDSENGGRKFL
jgi:hypothetical protein